MKKIRPRSLPVREILRLADQLTVDIIMTSRNQFKMANINDSLSSAKQIMKCDHFDQLPVQDGETIVGLVKLEAIEGMLPEELVSRYVDASIPKINKTDKLVEVLVLLRDNPCIFVKDNSEIVGLIHRSDLNKQAMRVYFYLWIAALEMGLATIVKSKYELPGEWVTLLSLKKQRSILNKKRNLDANPIEQAELSDLVKVIQKNEVIRCLLGFPKTKDWKDATGNLIDLRHRIMHPTRTLIDIDCGVEDLISRENNLKKLIITVDASLL